MMSIDRSIEYDSLSSPEGPIDQSRDDGGERDLWFHPCSVKHYSKEEKKKKRRAIAAAGPSRNSKRSKRDDASPSISVLTADLLASILRRLLLPDLIRSAAVCPSWNSLVSKLPRPKDLPWLMLPRTKADQIDDAATFYSLSHREHFWIRLPYRWARCVNSCGGWLFVADDRCDLHLLNPLTRARIPLPPSITLCDVDPAAKPGRHWLDIGNPEPMNITTKKLISYLFYKAIVVWTSDTTYTVMIIHGCSGHNLSFARQCDASWNSLALFEFPEFDDILYYRGQFCVLRDNGAVEAWDDLGATRITLVEPLNVADVVPKGCSRRRGYLVESPGGDLLQVQRIWKLPKDHLVNHTHTVDFRVFKLLPGGGGDAGRQWTETNGLGDYALFLGATDSVAISNGGEFPSLRPNCIYYSDDEDDLPVYRKHIMLETGVFDLESRTFGPFYPRAFRANWPLPMWFVPNLSKEGVAISEGLSP